MHHSAVSSQHSCSVLTLSALQVVSRAEAVARVRAACDARDAGSDIVIVARSDARSAISLDEALWRAAAFVDAVRLVRTFRLFAAV
jgi:2-methylisocitrate lyase-like PEP mutase family enzyme